MSHITDYSLRDAHRLAYLDWIKRSEQKLRSRPTPSLSFSTDVTITRPTKRQLLNDL